MDDYEVGYGKPPKNRRFKPGETGNARGRPRRQSTPLADCVREVMEGPAEYRERGQQKVSTWNEVSLRMLVERAANGDIGAADDILRVRRRAERHGVGTKVIQVENWLPDHAGQTASEKTQAVQDGRHTEPGQPQEQREV